MGDATHLTRKCLEDAKRNSSSCTVVSVGGDGTMNEVASGLRGSSMTLGIIPMGSGNDYARAHGIPLRNTQQAVSILKSGVDRRVGASLASTLPHLLTPGSVGRASKSIYGKKPIIHDYKIAKHPEIGGEPVSTIQQLATALGQQTGRNVKRTIEVRSAPTNLADPRLTKSHLELSHALAYNPEMNRRAVDFMKKNQNVTPLDLHTNPKVRGKFLDEIEHILHKGGVTSDPTLAHNLDRIAKNKPYIDEGWDIGKSWSENYKKVKDLV